MSGIDDALNTGHVDGAGMSVKLGLAEDQTADEASLQARSALVRVWLAPSTAVAGRAVAITDRTVWVELPWVPSSLVQIGEQCRLSNIFQQRLLATVRHVGARGVFLRTDESLPAWIPR